MGSVVSAASSSRSKENSVPLMGRNLAPRGRPVLVALLGLLILAVLLDRIAWASVAVWREDPATNIWLGYTRSALEMPVGLISTMRIPNPNGLVLASVILSRLPNLWGISAVLGVLQACLIAGVSWLGTRDPKLALLSAGPVLASITLRGASVDLWGLWTSVPVNFLFMVGLLIYIHSRSLWGLPLVVVAIIAGPAFYFSGLVTSIVFSVLALAVGLRWKPPRELRRWLAPLIVTVVIVALSIGLTWQPYLHEVSLADLSGAGAAWSRTPLQRFQAAAWSLFGFASFSLEQFAGSQLYTIGQVDPHLLSTAASRGYHWLLRQTWIQALLCYVSILAGAVMILLRRVSMRELIRPQHRLPAIMLALFVSTVVLSYMIAPLIGGPAWGQGERLDQVTQFLPFLLAFWFVSPVLLEHPQRLQAVLRRLTWISAVLFTVASMAVGLLVVYENLRYRGPKLTGSDVPVYDKLRLVAFAARDWKAHSSSPDIPIDYDLGGGIWDWITDFGSSYLEWYPAPYTIGRAFDYEFLRGHGLRNAQEGIQQRTFGSGRYLVNYAFEPAPALPGELTRDYEFGRLRLTIRDEWSAP
jgi:hypothetical protein